MKPRMVVDGKIISTPADMQKALDGKYMVRSLEVNNSACRVDYFLRGFEADPDSTGNYESMTQATWENRQ